MTYYIDLGGITFHGNTGGDGGWYFNELVDWNGLPDSKIEGEDIPLGDGSYDPGTMYRSSRAISFSGFFLGENHADVLAARDRITAWGAKQQLQPMTVSDESGVWMRMVSIRSIPIQDTQGASELMFTVHCVAPDPLRYGPETQQSVESNGEVLLVNRGTAEAYPMIEATGASGGFLITEVGTERGLQMKRSIGVGQSIIVDCRQRAVWQDDLLVTGELTRLDWVMLPPGGSVRLRFQTIGATVGTPNMITRLRAASW